MGITYTYFLDIIEKNTIDVNNEKGKETYIYTARLNEVILAQLPMVFFRYFIAYIDIKPTLWLSLKSSPTTNGTLCSLILWEFWVEYSQ